MRLASVVAGDGSGSGWGVLHDGAFISGASARSRWPSLRCYLESPDPSQLKHLGETAQGVPPHGLTLAPVLPDPRKLLCVGLNFEPHRLEMGRPKTPHPVIFIRYADTLLGHGSPLLIPKESSQLDYEGELAVVIGKEAHRVPEREALDHVAGFSIFQDASVRDYQNHTQQFTPGKNFAATGGFGPHLVTADEVPDYRRLELITRVNGEVRQSGRLSELSFTVEEVIAYCSSWTVLRPGDVIALGTPGGIGARRVPPQWLEPGDVVEVEVPGIGVLVNPVAAERGATGLGG